MTPVPLDLVYRERRQHPPRALLLAGDDAGTWLRTLHDAKVPLADVEFLPLPEGPRDRRLRGVLVVLPGTDAERLSHIGPLYGEIAGRLYLPVDGAVDPPVAEEEWPALLSADDSRFVWHPVAGLIRIEPEERLRTADLIRMPRQKDSDWSCAVPGPHLNTRLFALICDEPPTLEHLFESAGGEIGTSGNHLDQLPKATNEPTPSPLHNLAGKPLRAIAGLLKWMERQLTRRGTPGSKPGEKPTTSSGTAGGNSAGSGAGSFGPGFSAWLAGALAGGGATLGKALDSLANSLSRVTPQILSERTRQIERLLDRFLSDPDDALRYALPLAGEAGRGIAPPGSSLTPHSVDFTFGGTPGAVDAWSIPPDIHQTLVQRYREAAQREIRLGRYRRAAYIFSKLLGDDLAAAAALETGRFHREAAILYRDRLRQPLAAAQCLVRGGLLREAIELYREHRQHLEAGDLLVRLEEHDEAAVEYRQTVADRLARQDFVGAADVLLRKFSAEEEAFDVLRRGWPASGQAAECFAKLLTEAARLGRHELAAGFVHSLHKGDLPSRAQSVILERLPDTALHYPDPTVRDDAAETVRVVAARFLADPSRPVGLPLHAIERLVPDDRLLGRDCRRFKPAVAPPPRGKSVYQHSSSGVSRFCLLQRTIPLDSNTHWLDFKGTAAGYFAVGTAFRDNRTHLVLQRGTWEGAPLESLSWPMKGASPSGPPRVLMTIEQLAKTRVRLIATSAGYEPRTFPPLHTSDIIIDTPPWLARPGTLAADSFGLTAWTVDEALDVRTIDASAAGLPVTTASLPVDWATADLPPQQDRHAAIHVREQGAWIAVERMLFVMPSVYQSTSYELAAPVTRIFGSRPHTTPRVVLLSENGGELFLPTHGLLPLPADLRDPAGAFLRDGRLVLWTRTQGSEGRFLIFSIGPAEWRIVDSCDTSSGQPVGMLPTSRPDEFASLLPGGEIEIWKVATRR